MNKVTRCIKFAASFLGDRLVRYGGWRCCVLGFCLCLFACSKTEPPFEPETDERVNVNEALRDQVALIHEKEERLRETLWRNEVLAQVHGRVLEDLWDEINNSGAGLRRLLEFPIAKVRFGTWSKESMRERPFERIWCQGSLGALNGEGWASFLKETIQAGWKLDTVEFRHVRFDPALDAKLAESEFFLRSGLTNEIEESRISLEGALRITWQKSAKDSSEPVVREIDLRGLECVVSRGRLPFRVALDTPIRPPEHAHAIDPLLVSDLDSDGKAEITLANRNLIFRMNDSGVYSSAPLCTFPPGLISTGIFADLGGDGVPDFVCCNSKGLMLLPGAPGGLFDQRGVLLWSNNAEVVYPMVLSSGDIDRDGDLDLFLGQYRVPYEGGALPTPFYDANDGYPFFLLRNDGEGQFVDVTEGVGLTKNRDRRIYSGSLTDLDGKNGPDLLVVSDFAGADLYLNNGDGTFDQGATTLFGAAFGFGMAHTISDFNGDGSLDVLMIGMTSPTVDRLSHAGLWRSGLTEDQSMFREMTYGNRLFLSGGAGSGWIQNAMSRSISRSGWAWGCGSGDFDNDGYPDVFIGNGLESRQTVRDYESEYWLHDAYNADSEKDPAAYLYFEEKFARTRGKGHSYGGYESNRLYLNDRGESFFDVGYLWGLGHQKDTRNVVVQDLDGDGRVDVAMTSFGRWPQVEESLSVFLNQMDTAGHWVGFRFLTGKGRKSPMGARVQGIFL